MELTDWQITKCPHCRGLMRVKKDARLDEARCPTCFSSLAPAIAAVATDPTRRPSAIPAARSYDPKPLGFREQKESWEPQVKGPKEVEFQQPLATTADPELAYDPANPPIIRRRRPSRKAAQLTKWDESDRTVHRGANFLGLARTQWMTLGLVIAAGAVSIFVLKMRYFRKSGPALAEEAEADPQSSLPQITPPSRPEDALEKLPVSDYYDELKAVIAGFLNCSQPSEAKGMVRDVERVYPLMEAYYKRHPMVKPKIRSLAKPNEIVVHKRYVVTTALMEDYSEKPISLEKTPDGFKVDWESYVGYSELTWEELREQRPETSVLLRCRIAPFDYWNGEFSDQKKFASYRLTDMSGDHYLYGFAERGSHQQDQLALELKFKPTAFCVVRVRYPKAAAGADLVEVTEFLESGWMIRENDFSEKLDVPGIAPAEAEKPPPTFQLKPEVEAPPP